MSSQKRLCRTPGGWSQTKSPSSVCVADKKAFKKHSLLDLPPDLQRHILGTVSLRQLSQMACLNTELRVVYLERVNERDAVVAALLESHFTAEFREGLSLAETALPRDLIVDPPMSSLLQAAPVKCSWLAQIWRDHGRPYRGFCNAGCPDGRGECRHLTGAKYLGDWHKGHFHGRGTQVFADGSEYVGEFYEGMCQGQGTYTWADGGKYEGDYYRNHRHGKGRYKSPNGDVYVGEYLYNNRHGEGRYERTNGGVYDGQWVHNVRHGLGRETLISARSTLVVS